MGTPPVLGVGVSGSALKAMLDRSTALFEETGFYLGLSRMPLKESDPLRFERLRDGVESACGRARGRFRGGFGLHTPEGDVVAGSGDVEALRTAIEGLARTRREDDPDVLPGGAVADGARTLVPIFWSGELVAWASGTRLAGCQRIRDAVERMILDEGADAFTAFVHEAIEDGRRAFKQRVRALLVPGRYRSAGFADATAGPPGRGRIVHGAYEAVVADDGRIAVELCAASAQGPPSFDARGDLQRLVLEQGPTRGTAGNDGARYAIELKGHAGTWADVRELAWEPIARGMRSRGFVKESSAIAGGSQGRLGGYGAEAHPPEPVAEWWARERDRLLAGDLIEPLKATYAESMRLGPAWAAEYRGFWDLPEEFDFDVLTPSTPTQRAAPGKVTPAESVATFLLSADAFQPAGARVEDGEQFSVWVAWLQSCVPWDDPIVLPLGQGLNVVRRRADGELVIRTDAGHDLCRWSENWKMHASVLTWPAGDWMELREFYCPASGRLLDTEAVAPGYPVIHEYLPDVDGLYRGWLGRRAP